MPALSAGSELEFICEGEDEQEALAAVVRLVKEGLGGVTGKLACTVNI